MPSLSRILSKRHSSGKPSASSTRAHDSNRSHASSSRSQPRRPRSPIYSTQEFTASDISMESREYRRRNHKLQGEDRLSRAEFLKFDKEEEKNMSQGAKKWQAVQHRRHIQETIDALRRDEPRRKGESAAERENRIDKMADGSWEEPLE